MTRGFLVALLGLALGASSGAVAQRSTPGPLVGLDAYLQDALTKFKGVGPSRSSRTIRSSTPRGLA